MRLSRGELRDYINYRKNDRWLSCGEASRKAGCGKSALSGCVSSEGWHVQQETNLPGYKSEPRSLDSRGDGN